MPFTAPCQTKYSAVNYFKYGQTNFILFLISLLTLASTSIQYTCKMRKVVYQYQHRRDIRVFYAYTCFTILFVNKRSGVLFIQAGNQTLLPPPTVGVHNLTWDCCLFSCSCDSALVCTLITRATSERMTSAYI